MSFSDKAAHTIRAEIRMISGCEDVQTSADVSNVKSFQLPDPAGRAGGACTSALLKVLYADKKRPVEDLSYRDVLLKTRQVLERKKYEQVPQLSSSRPLEVETKFDITPDNFSGKKIALLIGINYVGQSGELSGCHNDVLNMVEYLKDVHGFEDESITLLMDDGENTAPTKKNIANAYRKLTRDAEAGDCVYLHYSGHGVRVTDRDGDEEDGKDECLVPVDFQTKGIISDDALVKILVKPLKAGVFVTSLMDCCHSGTILDLPYSFKAGETDMHEVEGFNFGKIDETPEDDGDEEGCVIS